MTNDELNAAYAARHSTHLQTMLGAASAQVIDLQARLDVANVAGDDLAKRLDEAEKQRDEALHMQAETMKTVEQSGQEIERLKAQLASSISSFDSLMGEYNNYVDQVRAENAKRAARRKPKT